MIQSLEMAIAADDEEAVMNAVFDLACPVDEQEPIDDSVTFEIIALLRRPEMWSSRFAGHVLNFFEFASPHLSERAKDRCAAFLREWGDQFRGVHGRHVVEELRHGPYLQPVHPRSARRKPRKKDV